MEVDRPSRIGALVVALLLASACGRGDDGATLMWPHEPNASAFGTEAWSLDARPWAEGLVMLCLDEPGQATIDRVVPVGGNGKLRITSFGVRRNPAATGGKMLGNSRESLAALGFAVGDQAVVATQCPEPGDDSPEAGARLLELAIQVQPADRETASFASVEVQYENDAGRRKRLPISYAITVCGPDDVTTAGCASP